MDVVAHRVPLSIRLGRARNRLLISFSEVFGRMEHRSLVSCVAQAGSFTSGLQERIERKSDISEIRLQKQFPTCSRISSLSFI